MNAAAIALNPPNPGIDLFEEVMRRARRLKAITQALCTSWKVEILKALHDFTVTTGHVFKIALYTSSSTMSAATTNYSTTAEISGTGYSAGGNTLVSATPVSSGTTAICDFADTSWTTATFTANGALIYNDTSTGDKGVVVLAFGGDFTTSGGTFAITFPAADASNAIVRIA